MFLWLLVRCFELSSDQTTLYVMLFQVLELHIEPFLYSLISVKSDIL